jgi:2-polyprenyl-3-methyl-5-hydroxy-6-metoxy-1,4-benzoquinol methylase
LESCVSTSGSIAPDLDPVEFPTLSGVERPFFEYWWEHIGRDDDPHRMDWVRYEERLSDIVGERTRLLTDRVDLAGKRLLDIGCQNGAWSVDLALAGADVYGIDVEEPAIGGAKIRGECHGVELHLSIQSAQELKFDDGFFDVVATSDVIEHVPDPAAMVAEMARVLKPGGLCFMSGPQRFGLRFFLHDPHYGHFGIAPLPGRWASWIARKVYSERVYEVETLPSLRWLYRELRRNGLEPEPRIPHPAESKSPLPARFDPLMDELRPGYTFLATKAG